MEQSQQTSQADKTLPTVLDHIREFRARLFWVVASILVASSAGYLIKDEMLSLLTRPLGDQQLYYLTPVGGLSFIIKLCFYFGFLVSVPVILYQLFRYLEPLMAGKQFSVVKFLLFSCALAACGVSFAYLVSLPAALHFLTDFNLNHITAMLTVDAYLTFVTSYLLGATILFQIPLVLLIIDKITPLTPKGLMGYQRHVILVAFIVAAVISPTPDVVNQALLAVPIIAMYQFGIGLIWLQGRRRKARNVPSVAVPQERARQHILTVTPFKGSGNVPSELLAAPTAQPQKMTTQTAAVNKVGPVKKVMSEVQASPQPARVVQAPNRRSAAPARQVRIERRQKFASIDGVMA